MHRLRNAGNTLVVVEHDPQVMVAARSHHRHRPRPGRTRRPHRVRRHARAAARGAHSLTGDYLGGRQRVGSAALHAGGGQHAAPAAGRRQRAQPEECLGGTAAGPAGLRDRRVRIGQIHAGAGRAVPRAAQARRASRRKRPARTTACWAPSRSPTWSWWTRRPSARPRAPTRASYVGAFDAIRKLFAQAPLAQERAYTAGTFSFNSGDGRCPTCGGTGFEHVEMQFLSDVLPALPGLRRQALPPEVLQVRVEHLGKSASIDEVLEHDGQRGAGLLQGLPRRADRPGAAGRRGPGIRAAGPARAHAVGRRGAAPEAGRPPGRGGAQRYLHRQGRQEGQPVPVRRTHHRPALRRRRAPDARLPQAAGAPATRCWSSNTTWT